MIKAFLRRLSGAQAQITLLQERNRILAEKNKRLEAKVTELYRKNVDYAARIRQAREKG